MFNILQKTNIRPSYNKLKRYVVETGFLALGRAIQSASHFEPDVIKEVEKWKDGYSFSMNVLPNGPSLVMQKQNGKLLYMSNKHKNDADLIVELKNLDTAFRMITTQVGVHHVYAEHKIGVIGNVAQSLALIRIIYIVEGYMFPEIMNKRILKQPPKMTLQKHINRLHIYTIGMIFGK